MNKILVVDDNHDILDIVKLMLKMHSYQVKTISRWEEIPQSIRSFLPDLILLDISLSGADGRDICKELKNSNETKDIPVILFTAHHHLRNCVHECLADGFVTKPFRKSDLLDMIETNLSLA